ncbi:MAG: hypothetical protein MJ252_03040 [archaeon]|nr:hypothetical protein [archaeon]
MLLKLPSQKEKSKDESNKQNKKTNLNQYKKDMTQVLINYSKDNLRRYKSCPDLSTVYKLEKVTNKVNEHKINEAPTVTHSQAVEEKEALNNDNKNFNKVEPKKAYIPNTFISLAFLEEKSSKSSSKGIVKIQNSLEKQSYHSNSSSSRNYLLKSEICKSSLSNSNPNNVNNNYYEDKSKNSSIYK